MIKYFLNLSDLGIYTVGYSFGMVMVIFMNAFGTAWSPFLCLMLPNLMRLVKFSVVC